MSQEQTFNAARAARSGKTWWQHLAMVARLLGAGSSTIPFGDNGDVFRALADVRAKGLCNSMK